jgi:glycosyltransferase involved in cell wall biosynthesis
VAWAWTHPKEMKRMEREARKEVEEKYTPEKNYKMLMEIYQLTIERAKSGN